MIVAIFMTFLTGIFYSSDYKIELGKYYDSQKQEREQGYVETFTIKNAEGKEQFVISITKVTMPSGQNVPNVYGAEYKQAILSRCGCTITSAPVKHFNHFEAQEFKLIRNGKGTCVYSTTKGKNLYSITYSAIGNKNTEEKYPDFEKIINTLEFF